jgi:gamma-glutamyltranspeptidase
VPRQSTPRIILIILACIPLRHAVLLVVVLLLLLAAETRSASRAPVRAAHGMVGSTTETASRVGVEMNAIAPRKRMLSSMTPTIVTRNGKSFLVVGSPGGPPIITTVLQVILNVIDHGMNVQEAVDAPRFHHQWLPDEIRLERQGFPADVVQALNALGHRTSVLPDMGDVHAIMIDGKTGARLGASDPRMNGWTLGY